MSKVIWSAIFALIAIVVVAPKSDAASAPEIDAGVHSTLDTFFYRNWGARELAHKSVGILVFPSVVKAGFGFGGEYGEGALLMHPREQERFLGPRRNLQTLSNSSFAAGPDAGRQIGGKSEQA